MRCAVPVRASVRDLLSDLLGRKVTVTAADPLELGEGRSAVMAAFRTDDGGMAAATVVELPLAAYAGAAIGMMTRDEAAPSAEGQLEGDLADFFHEVVNVYSKLLNSPSTPHVLLREVVSVPGEVASDAAELVLSPTVRHDYRVEIEGYGSGTWVLLA